MAEQISTGDPSLAEPVKGIHSEIAAVRLEQKAIEARRRPIEIGTLILLIVTAISTIATFVVFYEQLVTSRDAIDIAHADAARALDASSRPWVGVTRISIGPLIEGKHIVVRLEVENSGHTPAVNLRSKLRIAIWPTAMGAPRMPTTNELYPSSGTLFPGTATTMDDLAPNFPPPTASDLNYIAQRRAIVWIYGRLEYSDTGGSSHVTLVRLQYDPGSGGLLFSSIGNSAN